MLYILYFLFTFIFIILFKNIEIKLESKIYSIASFILSLVTLLLMICHYLINNYNAMMSYIVYCNFFGIIFIPLSLVLAVKGLKTKLKRLSIVSIMFNIIGIIPFLYEVLK